MVQAISGSVFIRNCYRNHLLGQSYSDSFLYQDGPMGEYKN